MAQTSSSTSGVAKSGGGKEKQSQGASNQMSSNKENNEETSAEKNTFLLVGKCLSFECRDLKNRFALMFWVANPSFLTKQIPTVFFSSS